MKYCAQTNIPYSKLQLVDGIRFTPREIDVISCILNGRTASRDIAELLSIAPSSVESHKRNINQKLLHTGFRMRNFIEKSSKYSEIQAHFELLQTQNLFRNTLVSISKKLKPKQRPPILLVTQEEEQGHTLFQLFKADFEILGINTKITKTNAISESKTSKKGYRIAIFFGDRSDISNKNYKKILLVQDSGQNKIKRFPTSDNYYCIFLGILELIFQSLNLNSEKELFSDKKSVPNKEENKKLWKFLVSSPCQRWGSGSTRKILLWTISVAISACIIIGGFYVFKGENRISSDLILPDKSALMERDHLLKKIDEKFIQQKHSITIPIVGIVGYSGSGKTAVARNYGRNIRNAAVVWEVNAEKLSTIISSFRELAYRLAESRKHTEELDGIMKISGGQIQQKQLITFIKSRLKEKPNWLLVYDNVTSLVKIIQFLPIYREEWGDGKILVTTRNAYIEYSNFIQPDNVIFIEELSDTEKFKLFANILYNKVPKPLSKEKTEEISIFLKTIPPFPLDVSIAAYLIKNTGITYDKYLDLIKNYGSKYEALHNGMLNDITNYTKTRYGIVLSTFEKLSTGDQNFDELLFLICTLDSQYIPLDFIRGYSNEASIDKFIFQLRQNGILLRGLSASKNKKGNFLSIHRVSQEIGALFLQQKLSKKQKNLYAYRVTTFLEKYFKHCKKTGKSQKLVFFIPNLYAAIAFISSMDIKDRDKYSARLRLLLGYTLYDLGHNYNNALLLFQAVQEDPNFDKFFSTKEKAVLLKDMALIARYCMKFKKGFEYITRSLRYSNNLQNVESLLADTYRIRGDIHRKVNNFLLASEDYKRALNSVPKIDNQQAKLLKSEIFRCLADLYYSNFIGWENGKIAHKHAYNALKILGRTEPYSHSEELISEKVDCQQALLHRTLAQIYTMQNQDFIAANKWIKSADLIFKAKCPGNKFTQGKIMSTKGEVLLRQNNIVEAINQIELASAMRSTTFTPESVWYYKAIIMEAYNKIGNFEKAYENFRFVSEVTDTDKSTRDLLAIYSSYYHAAHAKYMLGDYPKAIEHFEQFIMFMENLCKKFFDKKKYQKLKAQGMFTIPKYDEKHSSKSILKYHAKALEIYKSLYFYNNSFISDYIYVNYNALNSRKH